MKRTVPVGLSRMRNKKGRSTRKSSGLGGGPKAEPMQSLSPSLAGLVTSEASPFLQNMATFLAEDNADSIRRPLESSSPTSPIDRPLAVKYSVY